MPTEIRMSLSIHTHHDHPDATRHNTCHGFTLLEVMTVLALISITLLSSSTSLHIFVKRTLTQINIQKTTRQFIQDAHFARLQALKNQTFVSVLPNCGNHWDSGWMVIENPEFLASMEIAEEDLDQVHFKRPPLVSETTSLSSHLKRGNQFEDMSLQNTQSDCSAFDLSHPIASQSGKAKHLSFGPSGSAQMKHGGMVANRLVFSGREFPEFEQHITLGSGGRLRLCSTTGQQDCY
jgi:type IV fimbrial biogenesis protein FimT